MPPWPLRMIAISVVLLEVIGHSIVPVPALLPPLAVAVGPQVKLWPLAFLNKTTTKKPLSISTIWIVTCQIFLIVGNQYMSYATNNWYQNTNIFISDIIFVSTNPYKIPTSTHFNYNFCTFVATWHPWYSWVSTNLGNLFQYVLKAFKWKFAKLQIIF